MSASRPRVCRGGSAASWRTNIGVPPAGVDRRRMLPTAPHGGCSPVPADDSPAVDMPAPRRTAASLAARDDGVKRQWTVRPRRPHAMACTSLRPLSRTRPTGPVEAWPSRRPVGLRRGEARRRARKGWLPCAPSFMTVPLDERAAPPSASATAPPYTTTATRSEGVGRCYRLFRGYLLRVAPRVERGELDEGAFGEGPRPLVEAQDEAVDLEEEVVVGLLEGLGDGV